MASPDEFARALLQLGYRDFGTVKPALDKGCRSSPKSIWEKLSTLIFGKNKDSKRNSLSIKWRLNRANFQQLVKSGLEKVTPSNSSKPITSYSDIPCLAIEHISPKLESAPYYNDSLDLSSNRFRELVFSSNRFSKLDFSISSLERVVFDDQFLALLASGCRDPGLHSMRIAMASSPPHSGTTDTHHWTYANCDNLLWLSAVNFFGLDCPYINGEFILVNDELYESSHKFSDLLFENFEHVSLVKGNNSLLTAWVLVEKIRCQVLELFDNPYILIPVEKLELLVNFIMSARDNLCLLTSFHLSLTELIKCSSSVFQPTSLPTDLSPAADILDITPDSNVISNISAGPELFVTLGDDAVVNEIIVEDELICNENRGEFLINLDEWNKVCQIKGDSVIFSKDWTNLFSSKLEGIVICVLSFKYKRINKLNSRKNNNCFFRAKAECKFKNCLKYTFTIKKDTFELKPNNYIVVEYLVSGSLSEEHSDDKIVHSRNLSNTLRLEVATQLTEKSISKYFYNQFELSKNTQFALNSGNFNKIKSASVLRKAKFDLSSLQRYSNDNWSDLINLQQHYQETLVGCHVRGYIQSLGHNPFIIHLYTEEQINILKSFKKTSIILHLDATGSIVRRIEPSQKKVFYYALTVQHPTYTTSPVPLAEMISSAQYVY